MNVDVNVLRVGICSPQHGHIGNAIAITATDVEVLLGQEVLHGRLEVRARTSKNLVGGSQFADGHELLELVTVIKHLLRESSADVPAEEKILDAAFGTYERVLSASADRHQRLSQILFIPLRSRVPRHEGHHRDAHS